MIFVQITLDNNLGSKSGKTFEDTLSLFATAGLKTFGLVQLQYIKTKYCRKNRSRNEQCVN